MKNFLMLLFCLCSASLMSQYAVTESTTSILDHAQFAVDNNTMANAVSFTKMTSNSCPIENGYGVSACSFKELNQFMSTMSYPTIAFENQLEDKCQVSFTGNSVGDTENIIVSNCSGTVYGDAIKKHLSRFEWTPASKNGEAQDITVTFNMIFKTDM